LGLQTTQGFIILLLFLLLLRLNKVVWLVGRR